MRLTLWNPIPTLGLVYAAVRGWYTLEATYTEVCCKVQRGLGNQFGLVTVDPTQVEMQRPEGAGYGACGYNSVIEMPAHQTQVWSLIVSG